jgi:acyl-CoA thioesterase I
MMRAAAVVTIALVAACNPPNLFGALKLDDAPARVDGLLQRIHAFAPATRIFVASLPPLADAQREAHVIRFNTALAAKVARRVSDGWPIAFVDVHAAVQVSDLLDGIHPSREGHRRIAATWWRALEPVVVPRR